MASMSTPSNNAPVFALDETADWDDLENAMAASAEYQSRKLGKIIPLMFFSPMTEPDNLDAWEPMTTLPENLLITSIERSADKTLFKALDKAEGYIGETHLAASCPDVSVDYDEPLAVIYEQMADAGIDSFAKPTQGQDDVSFFFLRGKEAVLAFNRALRSVTS